MLGLGLTWIADIYSIIAYASRAFALYYALQCGVALAFARQRGSRPIQMGLWMLMGFVALAIVFLGQPAE